MMFSDKKMIIFFYFNNIHNNMHFLSPFIRLVCCLAIVISLTSCEAFKPKKVNTREVPINAQEAARKNVEEGKGISVKGLLGGGRGGNFEFSSSNPMWRASLEVLDFLPLTTVDYSGGVIITDWYSENKDEAIKITLRFLSNEISANSLKIIVHKKNCYKNNDCSTKIFNSKINEELLASILKEAALLDKKK